MGRGSTNHYRIAFLKKKKALVKVELNVVVNLLRTLLLLLVGSITDDTEYTADFRII